MVSKTISTLYQQPTLTSTSVSYPVRIFPAPIGFRRIAIFFPEPVRPYPSVCFQCGNESDKLRIQDIEQFKLSAENDPAIEAKPSVQNGGVDPAEVGVELQGAVIQISKAGVWAYKTTF